ncbi:hypothetical protein RDE2_24710 [Rhodococcus sp. RDE2]|nr:hypothetical protein RDE2_24710 [Rhodococcus sp. RDE2]
MLIASVVREPDRLPTEVVQEPDGSAAVLDIGPSARGHRRHMELEAFAYESEFPVAQRLRSSVGFVEVGTIGNDAARSFLTSDRLRAERQMVIPQSHTDLLADVRYADNETVHHNRP